VDEFVLVVAEVAPDVLIAEELPLVPVVPVVEFECTPEW
jgi:hypothetical protein